MDSNVWIDLLSTDSPFRSIAKSVLSDCLDAGARLVTSELSVAECIHKPYRLGETAVVDSFEALFASELMVVIGLDGPLVRRAARHGALNGLKLLDAVHHLTAVEQGCGLMITADRRIKPSSDLPVRWIG